MEQSNNAVKDKPNVKSDYRHIYIAIGIAIGVSLVAKSFFYSLGYDAAFKKYFKFNLIVNYPGVTKTESATSTSEEMIKKYEEVMPLIEANTHKLLANFAIDNHIPTKDMKQSEKEKMYGTAIIEILRLMTVHVRNNLATEQKQINTSIWTSCPPDQTLAAVWWPDLNDKSIAELCKKFLTIRMDHLAVLLEELPSITLIPPSSSNKK